MTPLEDYEQQTITLIRSFNSPLNALADSSIAMLYHEWSERKYCAGWLTPDSVRVAKFIAWATSSPMTAISSHPHSLSKEPLMQVSNGSGECPTATVDENAILLAENLAQPQSATAPAGIEIKVEPESFLSASGVESAEEFSGAGIEKTRCGHMPPANSNQLQYLIDLITHTELDLKEAFVQREKIITTAIDGTINTVISAVNRERIRVVSQFAAMLRSKILTGLGS
ncbi:MAG: hypothetical protein E6R03_05595 [Hyphomicrobiaceae bacterium]|nr:MAG: hypothetical protein E6R03_05595 [Hyphomicrobiaceae bacterium]